MAPFVDHVLFNAVAAAIIAPMAYASKWLRRPALTHAFWLIVLVRLVAPPMYTLPLPRWETEPNVQPVAQFTEPTRVADFVVAIDTEPTNVDDLFPQEQAVQPSPAPVDESIVVLPWLQITIGAWAAISSALLLGMISRALRFRRSLRLASAADGRLNKLVTTLSRRLGLNQTPCVILLSERMSPCVWAGLLRPTLALPTGWLDGLSRLQQTAVLVHELAHLRRRDHWVRWLELFAIAICWWHPVVWVARRELREAEELCCDGWVVATLPAARRAYADALVDTLDFLAIAKPALPPLASGFGQIHELKRRIHMILKTNPVYRPGRAGAILALGFAMLLPFGVARSDEPQDTPPPPPPPPERPRDDRPRSDFEDRERERANEVRARAKISRDRSDADAGEIDRLRDEMRKAEEQMAQAQQRIERLRRRLDELGANMPRPAGASAAPRGGQFTGGFGGGASFAGDRPRANQADVEKAMLRLRLQELELREKLGEDHPDIQKIRNQMDEIKRSTILPRNEGPGRGEGARGGQPGQPPAPPIPPIAPVRSVPATPFGGTAPSENRRGIGTAGGGQSGGDPRIDELAKAVSDLRRAVEEMRRDRERDRRPPQPNP